MKQNTKEKRSTLYNLTMIGKRLLKSSHASAHAAQAAYFFVLSIIPTVLLLLTLVRFTSIEREDVLYGVSVLFPANIEEVIIHIVNQVYDQYHAIIPFTIVIALWSAGRGVQAIISGLNGIYFHTESRNYFFIRFKASVYTLVFLTAIALSLVLSVFTSGLIATIYENYPVLGRVLQNLVRFRVILALPVLTVFWTVVYTFLPNGMKKSMKTMLRQLPGAIVAALGWTMISFGFSLYLNIFTGFSTLYGSLTTIILLLLWLYFCMYAILIGGILNSVIEHYRYSEKFRELSHKEVDIREIIEKRLHPNKKKEISEKRFEKDLSELQSLSLNRKTKKTRIIANDGGNGMNTLEAIRNRTSYRGKYKDTPVPREDLIKIMEAGLLAPSGCNTQTTSLIAVDDPEVLEQLNQVMKSCGLKKHLGQAIICVLTQEIIAYKDRCFNVHDYSAAIENMLLAIVSLGYQSCWYEGEITDEDKIGGKMADILGVPDDYELVCFLPVGVATDPIRHAKKKPFEERAWFNGFKKR